MLKNNVVLLIETQEELNQLAEITKDIALDSIFVDEPYLAFMDEVLWIVPQSGIDTSHWASMIKARKFSSWYRNIKNKIV